ncbi:MAG: GDSL-type esterase/lipase family protein [Deltaproteobacteria bacterium]|jgi:lysophospholipase L1-like esterase|nr:GDSL-type esterase/lipase family protein [Deltaproteobacteria bacterium]
MSQELSDKIVLLGDSLTEYWNWEKLLPPFKIVNQGIGGDTSMGIFSRVNYAANLSPLVISLQVGINDLSQGLDPAKIADNHLAIWLSINEKTPDTHLIVSSLMPISRAKLEWSSNNLTNERVRQTNRFLKANFQNVREGLTGYRFANGISWLDLYELTADPAGELPDHLTEDGVHLTRAAYLIWTETLKNHLKVIIPKLKKAT